MAFGKLCLIVKYEFDGFGKTLIVVSLIDVCSIASFRAE